jgi:hypothetical protein
MEQFVCVRIVQANRLDLQLFQFDYDLTFAVFFLNADRTVYGRYGNRSSHREAETDISLEGFREAMRAALRLHEGYPANEKFLRGKQPKKINQQTPDDFPSLRGKFNLTLNYGGQVSKSCMHCHQIRDADRLVVRNASQPMSERMLFPNPMPTVIGLEMDPQRRATISAVAGKSPAALAGLKPGDELQTLAGQAIVSTADIQWVLHHCRDRDKLPAVIRRNGKAKTVNIDLPEGWRWKSDIQWRASTWELRRMATGGIKLESLSDAERLAAGIPQGGLALIAKHVGQYGSHALAKRAGFRKGDVLVQVGNQTKTLSETQLLAKLMQETKPGDKIPTVVLRDGKRIELLLPTQ